MNIKNNFSKYAAYSASLAAVVMLAGGIAITAASAQVNISTSVSANYHGRVSSTTRLLGASLRSGSSTRAMSSTTRAQMLSQRQDQAISTIDTHSDTAISARTNSLNTLVSRVNSMTKLTATEKTTITTEVQNLISQLNALEIKIQADASSTPVGQRGDLSSSSSLRIDMESITKEYRVYALVIPQINILAAADRAQTLVTSMTTLSVKLQTRLTADQSAGKNVASLQASLSDINAKMADVQTQTTAAISLTANLTPDNGNVTIAASNSAALKSAQADIQTANSDIKTATAEAQSVVKGVEALGGNTSVSATVSGSTIVSSTTSTQ